MGLPDDPDLKDVDAHPDIDDPVAEFRRCGALRQADIDHLLEAGVPVEALAHGPRRVGHAIARDTVALHQGGPSFEFARWQFMTDDSGVSSYVVLALDDHGEPLDIVAFRTGSTPFVASWLGRVGLLGAEQLWWSRDVLQVHATVVDWLRAGREGVVVVDPVRAAPMLRDAGSLEVGSQTERRRILDLMDVKLPPVLVRAPRRTVA